MMKIEPQKKKIRWWLIVLGVLTFLADFAIPWTAEKIVLMKFTMRTFFVVVSILFIIAAFPGYEFLFSNDDEEDD